MLFSRMARISGGTGRPEPVKESVMMKGFDPVGVGGGEADGDASAHGMAQKVDLP